MKDTHYLKKELYELIKTDESIFDFIQESSLDGMWYWDLENPEEEWMNPKFWAVLGYDHNEMPHKASAWQNIIHPDDLKLATDNFLKHCENPDHPYNQTVRYTHKKGSTVWIRCRGMAIRDKDGKPIRMLGAHHDITELKEQEEQLHILSTVAEKLSEGVVITDPNCLVTWVNTGFERLSGYTLKELQGRNLNFLQGKDTNPTHRKCIKEMLAKKVSFKQEILNYSKEGVPYWIELSITPILDKNNEVTQFIGIQQDITEKKAIELEKDELTKRLNYALDASGDGIWDWNPITGEATVSKAYIEMLGFKEDEIDPSFSTLANRFHPDEAEWVLADITKVTQSPENGDQFSSEYRFRKKAGDYLWILGKGKVVERNEKGEAIRVIGTHTNITEQKESELKVRKSEEKKSAILDSTADLFFVFDTDLNFVETYNPIKEDLYLSPEHFIGKNLDTVGLPEPVVEIMRTALLDSLQKNSVPIVRYYLDFESGRKWFEAKVSCLKNPLGITTELAFIVRDISEDVKKQEEINHTSMLLNDAQRMANMGAWELNVATGETFWTDEVYNIHEVDKDFDHNKAKSIDFYHPEYRAVISKAVADTIANQIPYDIQCKFITGKNNLRWIRTSGYPIIEDGKVTRLTGMFRDITQEEDDKEAIKREQLFSKQLLENMADGFSVVDPEGRKIIVNKAFCEMTGFSENELLGQTAPHPYWPVEELKNIEKAFQKTMNGELDSFELIFQKKNGERFPILISTSVLKDQDGKPTNYFANVKDITEQKKTDFALQESEKKFRELFENLVDEVHLWKLIKDSNGKITGWQLEDANPSALKAWGKSIDEVIGKTPNEIFESDAHSQFMPVVEKIFETGIPETWEEYFSTTDQHLLMESIPLGDYFISSGKDITERKNIEIELKKTKDFLTQTNQVAQVGGWDFNILTGELYWAETTCEINEVPHGYQPSYKQLSDFYTPESWIKLEKAIQQCMVDGTPYDLELQSITAKNKMFWIRAIGNSEFHDGKCIKLYGVIQNIDDKKISELELEKTKEFLSQTNQVAKVGGWNFNILTGEINWSDTICDIHELQRGFVPPGEEMASLYTPESWTKLEKATQQTAADGTPYDLELQITSANDKPRWVRAIGNSEFKDGKCVRLFGVLQDINNKKIAELELEKTKDFLNQTSSVAKVGGWDFNILTGEIAWTDTICDIHEEPHGFVPSYQQVLSYYAPEGLIRLEEAVQSATIDGIPYDLELQIITAKGKLSWVRAIGNSEFEDGKCVRLFGVLQDINEKKVAELAMEESELRLSLATQAGGIGVADWDIVNNILTWDDQQFALYGVKREDFSSGYDAWISGVHEADKERSNTEIELALKGEKEFDTEFRINHPNGQIRTIKAFAKIVRDEEGNPLRMIGANWDITREKESLKQIEQAKEQAEAANHAKSEFLANMSHELRTPLSGVIGFTDLLKNTQLSPVQQQYANNANVSGHTLLGIIDDILDLSKIESRKLDLEYIKTDMWELLENSMDIVKLSVEDGGIELLLDIDPAMPRFATVDPVRLKQILVNLLGNAIKFTKKGEVALKVGFQSIDNDEGKLSISVRDTGIGISEEQKTKLFKSFSQADSSTSRKFGGTGLGLVISQMIAEKMGGKINIDSIPGVGTTFFFDIIADFEEGEKLDIAQLSHVTRCLIIDDNANNRLILKQMLNHWQIASDSCDNGLEAFKKIETSDLYDVIICDNDMPYINGLDTIRMMKDKLKLNTEKQPVILLSSPLDEIKLSQECEELKIRFQINKPVRRDDLFSALCLLDQQEARAIPQQEPKKTSLINDKIKILIAEDVVMNIVLVKAMLFELVRGVEVFEAKNGLEAIEQYKNIDPDIIFMDAQMPGIDGIEATKQIREIEATTGKHTPIIALTAGALKEQKDKCLLAGMDDFLTKPLEPQKIQAVLSKYFQHREQATIILHDADIDTDNQNEIHFRYGELLKNLRNNPEHVRKLIRLTVADMPLRINELEQACIAMDAKKIHEEAHYFRGASLQIRFTLLAKIAEKMENDAKDNSLDNMNILLKELKVEWETVKEILLKKME